MAEFRVFLALLVAVVVVVLVARPLRLAHPVALVLGGLVAGLLPFVPAIRIPSGLILLIFLPPILFPSAMTFASEDVRGSLRAIGALAVGLVLGTMLAVGAAVHFALGVPWAPAIVLGAILGATDPVAATAVIRRAGAPARLATILEGESLVNDGTGLTAFRIAVAAGTGGTFALDTATRDFLAVGLGGAAVGLAVGRLVWLVRQRVNEGRIEVLIAVLAAYGSYVAAEEVHVSGVLATVAAGWLVGRRTNEISSPGTRLQSAQFWGVVSFLAESILFLLIGLVFAGAVTDEHGLGTPALIGGVALVSAVVIGFRALWMFTVPFLAGLLDPRRRGPQALVPWRELVVLGFSGMRGAVSVAAALAVPLSIGTGRDTILFLAFGTVVVTLVVPTLALPWLLRALGLRQGDAERRHADDARLRLAHAALEEAERLAQDEEIPEDALQRARDFYELRIDRLCATRDGDEDRVQVGAAYRRLRRRLLARERAALAELRDRHEVSGETLRAIQRDLDLEDERLRR